MGRLDRALPRLVETRVKRAMRVVVLGGYGNFGARLAERLAPGFDLVVAGRNDIKARDGARRIGAHHAQIDITAPGFAHDLAALAPTVVIHTAGPFQGQDYAVAQAAIACGAHYIDLADGREFVSGIGTLDAAAQRAGRLVASGASSVPCLSAAVVDSLKLARVESIDIGIATSEQLPGPATMAAVLGYVGRPIPMWIDGRVSSVAGWGGHRRHHYRHLGRRALAYCDVPDTFVLPQRYAGLKRVTFRAGLGLAATHYGTAALAYAVRLGVIRNAAALAGPLTALGHALGVFSLPWRRGQSAMYVDVCGVAEGGEHQRWYWQITARRNHGLNIPAMAAVALARKLATTEITPGARPAAGLLSLDEYLAELRHLDIQVELQQRGG